MIPIVSTDASPGFATSVFFQDLLADTLAAASRYMVALGLDELPDTTPTAENMLNAKALLGDQLLNGFPFADASASANALAMVLEPSARPFITGPTPLYVISGIRGCGKTSLLKAATRPYQVAEVVETCGVRREIEWQRIISMGLSRYPSHFFIDGQASCLLSPTLLKALTDDIFTRRLPHSRTTSTLPILCTWAFASAEPKMSQDIASRAVHIPLTGQIHLEGRRTNEVCTITANQYFAAVLTLLRGWLEAGQPKFTNKPSRFTNWSQVMGGILEVAGVPGFLQDQE